MKATRGVTLIIGLIIGVLIGSSIGYAFFSTGPKMGAWHEVTSFNLVSTEGSMPGYVQTAYSYPNVYYGHSPLFTVGEEFWRMKVETIPYYNYTQNGDSLIIYYNQQPINTIRIWRDEAYVDNPFSSIVLLDPTYDYNVNTVGTAQALDQYFYVSWKEAYEPVETTLSFSGSGNYLISIDAGIGSFKFTIEEYS
jgi:hypothetical protein